MPNAGAEIRSTTGWFISGMIACVIVDPPCSHGSNEAGCNFGYCRVSAAGGRHRSDLLARHVLACGWTSRTAEAAVRQLVSNVLADRARAMSVKDVYSDESAGQPR